MEIVLLKKLYNKLFSANKAYKNHFESKGIEVKNKKIVIFGTGNFSEVISSTLPYNVDYYLDNNSKQWGKEFFGKPIKNPEVLKDENKDNILVLVASDFFYAISMQLESDYSLKENLHFAWTKDLYDELEDYYFLTVLFFFSVLFVAIPFVLILILYFKLFKKTK